MFGNLLKEKLIIEEKVRKLQNKYIALIQQSIVGNIQSEEQQNCVEDNLRQKQEILNEIKQKYTEISEVYNNLEKLLADTKETALKTEELIDNLAESLNIEFPQEFTQQESTEDYSPIQNREDNQHNILVEVDSGSDKENSKIDTTPENSATFFSPNIQIRKSAPLDDQLYTPACKSHSKQGYQN